MQVFLLFFTSLFAVINTLAAEPTLRIFCAPAVQGQFSELQTLRSDVISTYPTPTVKILDENGKSLSAILSYQPWQGSALENSVVVLGRNRSGQTQIYLTSVNIAQRQSKSELLGPSQGLSSEATGSLSGRRLMQGLLAISGDNLIYPGPQNSEWILMDLSRRSQESLPLLPNLANPRFSANGQFLFFDFYDSKTLKIKNIAYSLAQRKIVFETPTSKNHNLFLEFNPQTQGWVWLSSDDWSAKLVQLSAQGRTETLVSFENIHDIGMPITYGLGPMGLEARWSERAIAPVYNDDHVQTGIKFIKSRVQNVTISDKGLQIKSFQFSKQIMDMVASGLALDSGFMGSGIKAPNSNEIIFSAGIHRGLAKLNLLTGAWSLHANSFSGCYYPKWTYEVQ